MLLFVLLHLLPAQPLRPIPYYDPSGRSPSTYEDYSATRTDAPYEAVTVHRTPTCDRDGNLVLVFVNASLATRLVSELSTYITDITGSGFSAKVLAVSGGRPLNLRQTLQAHVDSGLVGGLMVGDLPVAWWEDGSQGEDYPLELFFTDLNGVFQDNDGDGKYDYHSGNRAPEIWLGRVHASGLTYDTEERLIKRFFQRNHAYRTGALPIPRRGLVYNEVTWYPNNHGMNYLYSDITMFNDENTTTAYHYKNQLRLGYEFVHIIAHSSPWVHTFFLQGEVPGGGSLFNFEVPALAPNAAFYFLNACMCARFTEKDNLGNWYLFAQPWGQAVIASTQLMYGVSSLRTVYEALGRDSCFGAAFLAWHKSNYSSFLGTCLLGDPTLRVNSKDPAPSVPPPVRRPSAPAAAPLAWIEYAPDSSNFVNGNPDIDCRGGTPRIVFDSGRRVRSDTYWSWFNGANFSRPESVAWHAYYDLFPACVTDAAGRFWVVWQSFRDYSSYEHFQLFSSYYHNGSWSSVRRVGPLAGYHDIQPALAAGTDDKVWCAFQSWRNGQADIWVSSAQAGGNWADPARLTTDSLSQISPAVAVDANNRPWVFWSTAANGNWRIQGRHHDGTGWLPAFEIDGSGDNSCPSAAAGPDGTVWVVWHKWSGTRTDIYYSFWNGSEWSEPAPVTDDPADDVLADVCCDQSGAWACWQSNRTGSWDIYVSRYADGWTPAEPVTADDANDYDPAIGTDGANVWVTWASDRRGYWNIYAARTGLTGVGGPEVTATGPGFVVSPNPFSGRVLFTGPGGFRAEVYSTDGRKVADLATRNGRLAWTPGRLGPGLYIAHLSGPEGRRTVKLVRTE